MSTKITIEVNVADAARICRAFNEGRLPGVLDVALAKPPRVKRRRKARAKR